MPRPAQQPTVLFPTEVASRVRMHPKTIKRLIREKRFPGYQIGRRYFIPEPWLEAWERGEQWKDEAAA